MDTDIVVVTISNSEHVCGHTVSSTRQDEAIDSSTVLSIWTLRKKSEEKMVKVVSFSRTTTRERKKRKRTRRVVGAEPVSNGRGFEGSGSTSTFLCDLGSGSRVENDLNHTNSITCRNTAIR